MMHYMPSIIFILHSAVFGMIQPRIVEAFVLDDMPGHGLNLQRISWHLICMLHRLPVVYFTFIHETVALAIAVGQQTSVLTSLLHSMNV